MAGSFQLMLHAALHPSLQSPVGKERHPTTTSPSHGRGRLLQRAMLLPSIGPLAQGHEAFTTAPFPRPLRWTSKSLICNLAASSLVLRPTGMHVHILLRSSSKGAREVMAWLLRRPYSGRSLFPFSAVLGGPHTP